MVFTVSQPVPVSDCYFSSNYQSQPDPEVLKKPVRRRFTAEYKLHILREADICSQRGQISALLHREGLSSSNLTTWRRQRQRGQLQALQDNKRGRKAKASHPLEAENERLRQENQQLAKRLKEAELMLDIPKKASKIHQVVSLSRIKSDENDSWWQLSNSHP